MEPIEIRRMRVRSGALDLEVGLALDTLYVDAGQAERILGLLPNPRAPCLRKREERWLLW